ncbi:FliH/SctL family protein, partial [Peptococcaceae bacterium]|nr:FliH/SctL family protein [Peptococcaceae bacterium]
MYRVIKEALVDTSPLKLEKRKRNIIEGIENTSPLLLKAVQDKAKAIILEAEKKAADLLKEAQAKSQQEFEKARERGYQEGYKAGIERANEEGELIRKKAEDILRQAEAERKEILECLKYEIISLSKEIAEKILNAQLELNPDLVIKTALEAIKLVKDRERVVFYVNP